MISIEGIHMSIDEARIEIAKRWEDVELRKNIEKELGDNFIPAFSEKPRGISFRQVCSPDNGFTFFFQRSKYIGVKPLILEYHDDMFTHLNEEKKGLGRLRVTLEDGTKATVDIMDFHAAEKKKLRDVVIKTGQKLVDFHHDLFKVAGHEVDLYENSNWFHRFGDDAKYYPILLLHLLVHGIWFENVEAFEDDHKGIAFINEVYHPTIKEAEKKFGLNPVVVRLYPDPESQTAEEDFYWWSYPPNVNAYIVDYARKHNLKMKEWRG